MKHIDINLMTTPQTCLNGKPVYFPSQKAEALFYYIAVEKVVTRNQVTAMFWPDMNNEPARQNMRQTLYVLNKAFGNTVIQSLPNHQLGLSNTFTIQSDLDDFYEKRALGLYKGEILRGFTLRNSAPFEEWLRTRREAAQCFFRCHYSEYTQAVPVSSGLVYRAQFKMLAALYAEYLAGHGKAVLLSGENGIGKSVLSTEFLDAQLPKNAVVLRVTCYMNNKGLQLRPWNDLLLQLYGILSEKGITIPNTLIQAANRLVPVFGVTTTSSADAGDAGYSDQAGKNSIVQILLLLARQVRLVVLFGNIHAMDASSLDILTSLVHTARQEMFILCTSLDIVDRDTEAFISATLNNWQLSRIFLPLLTFEETAGLIHATADDMRISDARVRDIYQRSQGNQFFIREILWNLRNDQPFDSFSPLVLDMLNDHLSGLDEPARMLLEAISVYPRDAVLDELCFLQKETAVKITQQLELLKGRGLILEKVVDDRVCFLFAHTRMRDFVYSKIPPARKRMLHERMGNYAKTLQDRILKLSDEMPPSYQPFVVVTNGDECERAPQVYLQRLLDDLAETRERQSEAMAYDHLEAVLLLAQSRCLLHCGEAEAGIAAFTRLLDGTYVRGHSQFLFRACLQLLDYVIQNGSDGILTSLDSRFEKIMESIEPFERAAFQQLQALTAMLCGNREKTSSLLEQVTDQMGNHQPTE